MKKMKRINVLAIVICTLLAVYAVAIVFLILWGISTSLKAPIGRTNVFRGNEFGLPQGWPWDWAWDNFSTVFANLRVILTDGARLYYVNFLGMAINTVLYAFGGAIISTFTPCLVAYAVAKCDFKFNKVIEFIVIMAMVIPVIGSYPSEIQVLKTLNLFQLLWHKPYI